MENAYIINGGSPLKGRVELSGAKNVAVKVLIAALLFEGEVTLHNIPRIRDVFELTDLLKELGAEITFVENTIKINGATINSNRTNEWSASKIRTSFMLFAPLLHKFKEAYIPNPGGCKIGARSLDRIVEGMESLGIDVDYDEETGYYHARMNSLPEGNYSFKKSSHTGTELLLILSALSTSKVVISNAALEPEVDDLICFINEAGGNIKRNGTSIIITGVKELKQTRSFTISADRIEAATYAVIAIATKGDITISNIEEPLIKTFNEALLSAGGGIEKVADGWRYFYKNTLEAVSITTGPHPGFMTDWQPPWAILMMRAKGETIIHERIYENRFAYSDELKKMGAEINEVEIEVLQPETFYFFNYEVQKKYSQAIRIPGPQSLHSAHLKVEDLRAGATLVIAALATGGESVITGIEMIERGYEKFVEKITNLGGSIQKVEL